MGDHRNDNDAGSDKEVSGSRGGGKMDQQRKMLESDVPLCIFRGTSRGLIMVDLASLNHAHFRDLFLASNFNKTDNKVVVLDSVSQMTDAFCTLVAPVEVVPPTKKDRRKLCERGWKTNRKQKGFFE